MKLYLKFSPKHLPYAELAGFYLQKSVCVVDVAIAIEGGSSLQFAPEIGTLRQG
jgi:hypothetical protein